MTSEDSPTVQVGISNIKKEIVGSRHKKVIVLFVLGVIF